MRRSYIGDAIPEPFAYYPFNDNALDYSGNERHIVGGVPPQYTDGYMGKQALLGSSYLSRTGLVCPISINTAWRNFTFICRFYLDSYRSSLPQQHHGCLFGLMTNFWLQASTNSSWSAWDIYYAGTHVINANTRALASTILAGNWYTFAVSYNSTVRELSVFVDGMLSIRRINISPIFTNPTQGGTLRLGADSDTNGTRWFSGKIQDVYIFNEPLTGEQVTAIMNCI